MMNLQKIPGFESTAYAYEGGRVVWAGLHSTTDHPRNAHMPWQPPVEAPALNAARLQAGSATCLALFNGNAGHSAQSPMAAKGLLAWLIGQPLAFPLNHATARFDAVHLALQRHDLSMLGQAAVRLLGLGHGLTPSGDDFVGGIMFTLHHLGRLSPAPTWLADLPELAGQLRVAAQTATNVISAALLDDLLNGSSYRVLHELLAAFDSQNELRIESATAELLRLGASSGADLLAGVLLALTTLRTSH